VLACGDQKNPARRNAMNGQQARMYRLYFSDEFDRVEWQALHCASDAEAFAEAAALMGDSVAVRLLKASEL
jgi:hypothetical protein